MRPREARRAGGDRLDRAYRQKTLSLRYALSGREDPDAETVVLSAGLGGSAGFWHPQMEALQSRYRVLAYDHRGTGANREPLPDDYTIGHMAADVLEVLDAAGIARAHLLGHALGGLVGLQLALDAPARLRSLVLVNAWAKAGSHTRRCFEARIALLEGGGAPAYVRAQAIFLYPAAWLSLNEARVANEESHAIAHFQGADTLLKRIGALLAFDATDRLGAITVPTLVASSRDDILVPYTASEALAAVLPNAAIFVVPEGGHGFTVTDPAPFNAVLTAFLERPAVR